MPNSLPTSGPYTVQDLLNAVLDGSGSAWVIKTQAVAGTGTILSATTVSADSVAQTGTALYVLSASHLYNGSSTAWDRERGNHEVIVMATAAYTATSTSTDQINYNARGMALLVDITAGSASGTLGTIDIQAKNGTTYLNIYQIVPGAITTGSAAFLIYPGAASAGAWTVAPVQGVIPRNWRLRVRDITGTSTMTYSITASYLV